MGGVRQIVVRLWVVDLPCPSYFKWRNGMSCNTNLDPGGPDNALLPHSSPTKCTSSTSASKVSSAYDRTCLPVECLHKCCAAPPMKVLSLRANLEARSLSERAGARICLADYSSSPCPTRLQCRNTFIDWRTVESCGSGCWAAPVSAFSYADASGSAFSLYRDRHLHDTINQFRTMFASNQGSPLKPSGLGSAFWVELHGLGGNPYRFLQ